jgi:hypothetical protein
VGETVHVVKVKRDSACGVGDSDFDNIFRSCYAHHPLNLIKPVSAGKGNVN